MNKTKQIDDVVSRLNAGEVVALPTETVYGLAGDAENPEALEHIFALKRRPKTNPLIIHIADQSWLERYAIEVSPIAKKLIAKCWPGPLTLVFKRKASVADTVTASQDTVAIRCPAHPVMQQVLQQLGRGLCAPSANRYTELSNTSADAVAKAFAGDELTILDGGDCEVGIESSIVDVSGEQPRLLRPGMLSAEMLSDICGCEVLSKADHSPTVPGNHFKHYAPSKPLQVFTRREMIDNINNDSFIISLVAIPGIEQQQVMGTEANSYASKLYQAIRIADQSDASHILVEAPPTTHEWHGINDRLQRATHNK